LLMPCAPVGAGGLWWWWYVGLYANINSWFLGSCTIWHRLRLRKDCDWSWFALGKTHRFFTVFKRLAFQIQCRKKRSVVIVSYKICVCIKLI
jgi:hypothetical protein